MPLISPSAVSSEAMGIVLVWRLFRLQRCSLSFCLTESARCSREMIGCAWDYSACHCDLCGIRERGGMC
jgi:hypothetical protein